MEESRLIKLMANFPACDLGEAYFKRWKEIFSEAVEFEKEVQALRSWKEKARPFLELYTMQTIEKNHDFALWIDDNEKVRDALNDIAKLTELLGGDDESNPSD